MATSNLLDRYTALFGKLGGVPTNPLSTPNPPVPVAQPLVAPVTPVGQSVQVAPIAAQPNLLDIIKAAHRDPLGDVARRNAQGNLGHSIDDWHALFAPSHTQPVYTQGEHLAALQQSAPALRAAGINIGGGHVVQPDQVHTDLSQSIQHWQNPDGSANFMFTPHLGGPAQYGSESGHVNYPGAPIITQPRLTPYSPNETLSSLFATSHPLATSLPGIPTKIDAAPVAPPVMTDAQKLQQLYSLFDQFGTH